MIHDDYHNSLSYDYDSLEIQGESRKFGLSLQGGLGGFPGGAQSITE